MMQALIDFWYGAMEAKYLSKQAHFTGDFMLTTLVGHLTLPWIGLAAGLVAAVGKEVIDKVTGRGCPQISAALVSAAGAMLAWLIMGGVVGG